MAITCVGLAPIARLEHRRPSRATGNAHLQTVSRMTACRVTSISRAVRQGERTGETKGLLTAAVSQWRCHHRRGGLPSGKPSAAAAARSAAPSGSGTGSISLLRCLVPCHSSHRCRCHQGYQGCPVAGALRWAAQRAGRGRSARRQGGGWLRARGAAGGGPVCRRGPAANTTHETRCTNTHRNQS